MVLLFRLCREGYAASIQDAKEMTAREVLQAIAYENFCSDYEAAWLELNR
jgi:hypothetical protein